MRYYITDERALKIPDRDFVEDLRQDGTIPFLHEWGEYDGAATVKLCCTQHWNAFYRPDVTAYKQRTLTQAWAEFLSGGQLPIKIVQFCTRTPQSIFDAICTQRGVTSLRFKWLAAADIRAIAGMEQLKKLEIDLGASITDLTPIGDLSALETLVLGSTVKVCDYSPLGRLKHLKELVICSYPTRVPPDVMHMETDAFLADMPKLRYLDLSDVRIERQVFLNEANAARYAFAYFRLP